MDIKNIISLILIVVFIINCLIAIWKSLNYEIKDIKKEKFNFTLQSFVLSILIIFSLYI